jgi:RND family efflux transporter MFP subunit
MSARGQPAGGDDGLSWWKQALAALALIAAAVAGWAVFLPEAAPLLARLGLPAAEGAAPSRGPGGGGGAPRGASAAVTVIGTLVGSSETAGRVSAIGDGRAIHSVSVTPLVSGRLIELGVASGQHVDPGDMIARLDAETEAIALARAELAVAESAATLERFERLRESGAATDVALREARLAARTADLELRDASLELERRTIRAPIGGIVGILPVEPGTQVSTSTEIAVIDDRSRILVDFRVPERFAGRLAIGDTVDATALARPELPLDGEIVALDSRVDPASRTLHVQAALANPDDQLRGGMAFAIELAFRGETYPAIDPLAIQWGADGAFVWIAREGLAKQVPVRIVQRNSDVILVSGELVPGERVITEGIQRLRPDIQVVFEGEDIPVAGGETPRRDL